MPKVIGNVAKIVGASDSLGTIVSDEEIEKVKEYIRIETDHESMTESCIEEAINL